MLDYNEIYIILNSYSYNERSLNVYDNKTNMQITNINVSMIFENVPKIIDTF